MPNISITTSHRSRMLIKRTFNCCASSRDDLNGNVIVVPTPKAPHAGAIGAAAVLGICCNRRIARVPPVSCRREHAHCKSQEAAFASPRRRRSGSVFRRSRPSFSLRLIWLPGSRRSAEPRKDNVLAKQTTRARPASRWSAGRRRTIVRRSMSDPECSANFWARREQCRSRRRCRIPDRIWSR